MYPTVRTPCTATKQPSKQRTPPPSGSNASHRDHGERHDRRCHAGDHGDGDERRRCMDGDDVFDVVESREGERAREREES